MAVAGIIRRLSQQKIFEISVNSISASCQMQQKRFKNWKPLYLPAPGTCGTSFRRTVHYPEGLEYTVKPLKTTNLAGRDPETGRVVVKGWGGGIKHKYHWPDFERTGPTDLNENPKEEKVLEVFEDGCRNAHLALVASGRELKYVLATVNMKPGDIIRTHKGIPRIPVKPNEGDAYPLGALPIGSIICNVERYPGMGACYAHSAGVSCSIVRKDAQNPGFVVVRLPSKKEMSVDEKCMATVGRISNVEWDDIPWGTPNAKRRAGYRPRSGLWHRKDGRYGRKIKRIPPAKVYKYNPKEKEEKIMLTLPWYLPA